MEDSLVLTNFLFINYLIMQTTTQLEFTLFVVMLEDWNDPRFSFNAKNKSEAESLALSWAMYHGMVRSDIFVELTTNEHRNEHQVKLHNEYMKYL